MTTQSKSIPDRNSSLSAAILGILAALLIASVLTGLNAQVPLVNSDRAAFVALVLLGIAMCATGGISVAIGKRGWTDIVTIIGSVLGLLALALVALVLLGAQLPLIPGDRQAFSALAGLGAVKVLIAAFDGLRK